MKWMSLVLVTALLVQVVPCSARSSIQVVDDTNWTIVPGKRVRIKAPSVFDRPLVGSIVTVSADSLVLRSEKQSTPLTIPLASVTNLEVSWARESNAGKGSVIGLLAGAGIGFAIGSTKGPFGDTGSKETGAGLAALFGLGGLMLGGTIGSTIRTEEWEEVPTDRIRLGLLPHRHGGLALSFSF